MKDKRSKALTKCVESLEALWQSYLPDPTKKMCPQKEEDCDTWMSGVLCHELKKCLLWPISLEVFQRLTVYTVYFKLLSTKKRVWLSHRDQDDADCGLNSKFRPIATDLWQGTDGIDLPEN